MQVPLSVVFPPRIDVDTNVGKHSIRHLASRSREYTGVAEVILHKGGGVSLRIPQDPETWIVERSSRLTAKAQHALVSAEPLESSTGPSSRSLRWIRPAPARAYNATHLARLRNKAIDAWKKGFKFAVEDDTQKGLRPPQLGAVHALLAHWTVSDESASVVMPTGIGKTETMMAMLALERMAPLLVVVPSRALRDQIAEKFLRLGVLPDNGVLPPGVVLPVVGTIRASIQDRDEAAALLEGTNVILSTMAAIAQSSFDARNTLSGGTTYLFVDEAHHVSARTWKEFRELFAPRRVVHFTATPFRADKRLMPGKFIYTYPLKKAQAEGYFRPIHFKPVREFDPARSDNAIASAALDQLESDLASGLDHILLARAQSIGRAEEMHALYQGLSERPCVLVHSNQSAGKQREALASVESRAARVVICVDMLGEGYDLPALKIAALHDTHRGLGVTLQFIGRFTRGSEHIGDATAIANIADLRVEEAIAELYSQDADWDALLDRLSEGAVGRELRRAEFIQGFRTDLSDIPLQNIYPKMSTVVYRVPAGRWRPKAVTDAFSDEALVSVAINESERVAIVVTQKLEPISWGEISHLQNVVYDLYLAYFDASQNLLFIHSSDNRRLHIELAQVLGGDDVDLVRGMPVFRALSGINRLVVANLGLRSAWGRSVRFTMYAGADVNEGLSESSFQNKTTSNIFGFGFESGDRASAGCSYKGRLWAYKISQDIDEWRDWCRHVGAKLRDESIDPAEILRTTMTIEVVTSRPPELVPIAVEWSENVWARNEDAVEFQLEDELTSLLDVGIDIVDRTDSGPLSFRVFSSNEAATFELRLSEQGPAFVQTSGGSASIRTGGRLRPLEQWFLEEPPVIRFHNGQQLVGDLLLSAPTVDRPFSSDRVEVWDWSGTDLSKESQGPDRDPASIQRRVIEELVGSDADIVFNDDGTNEAADVVTVKVADDDIIQVRLFHCKWASGGTVGHRIQDLYEVCGQAQKSVHWKGDREKLLEHLARRDARWTATGSSRFEKGDQAALADIARRQRLLTPEFEIVIVQPGLSKGGLTDSQRDVLAATQLYLAETYAVPLRVIASA